LSAIIDVITGTQVQADMISSADNVQTMPLLTPAMNIDPTAGRGGGDITIVDDSALLPQEGPSGTIADIEKPKNGTVSTYVVQPGDTLSGIAKLFGVTANTILWANDLTASSVIQSGQSLIILPVTGIAYTVQKGDTLETIAKQFGGDATEIGTYNGVDNSTLAVGTEVIIPNGEAVATSPAPSKAHITVSVKKSAAKISEPAHNVGPVGTIAEVDYYIAPLSHYIETQGIHGYNAVDLAAPMGTPIMAAATGDVVVAKQGGWNGGYGSYVVISHDNGSQTLYAHMSKVATYDGAHVVQGEVIGYVGQTGLATGPHVHFEIRNGIKNPF
jgi:murein DD-endopeptidase MepM/ murein hydrolase activator NlpD